MVLMYGTFSIGLTWHAFGLCRVKICELWNSMNLHVMNSAGQIWGNMVALNCLSQLLMICRGRQEIVLFQI